MKYNKLKTYLSSHNTLSLLDQATFGALTQSISTGFLVASKTGDQPMVSTTGALWHPCSPSVHFKGLLLFILKSKLQ